MATLDVITGGLAFCGLGAGWWDREHAAFGLPIPPAKERFDQLETAIETLRALWRPGTKAYAGYRVSLPETTCYPRPVSAIPIIVGGSGERRTLDIAARLADGCNLPAAKHVLEHKLAVLRKHCEQAGRDPAELQVTVLDVPVLGRTVITRASWSSCCGAGRPPPPTLASTTPARQPISSAGTGSSPSAA